MEKACLAVSIIAIFFFIFSAIAEVFLARNHRREKRFGPSPHNNYTSGSGRKPESTRRSRFGAGAAGGGGGGDWGDGGDAPGEGASMGPALPGLPGYAWEDCEGESDGDGYGGAFAAGSCGTGGGGG